MCGCSGPPILGMQIEAVVHGELFTNFHPLVFLNLDEPESAANMFDFTEFRLRHYKLKHLISLPYYPGSQAQNHTSYNVQNGASTGTGITVTATMTANWRDRDLT